MKKYCRGDYEVMAKAVADKHTGRWRSQNSDPGEALAELVAGVFGV